MLLKLEQSGEKEINKLTRRLRLNAESRLALQMDLTGFLQSAEGRGPRPKTRKARDGTSAAYDEKKVNQPQPTLANARHLILRLRGRYVLQMERSQRKWSCRKQAEAIGVGAYVLSRYSAGNLGQDSKWWNQIEKYVGSLKAHYFEMLADVYTASLRPKGGPRLIS
jgi:hypothetical protein